jgi:hypothetical protein
VRGWHQEGFGGGTSQHKGVGDAALSHRLYRGDYGLGIEGGEDLTEAAPRIVLGRRAALKPWARSERAIVTIWQTSRA